MPFYTCRPDPSGKSRITKLDADFNPEASYLTDAFGCDCPAGKRPICRHRTMLTYFQEKARADGRWAYDFDTGAFSRISPEDSGGINLEAEEESPSPERSGSSRDDLRRVGY